MAHTSEKALSQFGTIHLCGFSPVWVRIWTVSALRCMKLLSQQCLQVHSYGLSLVWIRKCRCRSDFRLKLCIAPWLARFESSYLQQSCDNDRRMMDNGNSYRESNLPWDIALPCHGCSNRTQTAAALPTRATDATVSLAPASSAPDDLWRKNASPTAWWFVVVVGSWKAGKQSSVLSWVVVDGQQGRGMR